MSDPRLAPRLRHRVAAFVTGPGWRRRALLRRSAALALAAAALVLALAPPATVARSPVLVAAADLAGGTTVSANDVVVRQWPSELAPTGVLDDPAAAAGRVLVGAARAGEPLTDRRLVGAGPDPRAGTAAVPVRLADAAVAALLVPGRHVDVVTVGKEADTPTVLAEDATVLAVLAEDNREKGRLVIVGMPRATATRVAAAGLAEQVAVTLR